MCKTPGHMKCAGTLGIIGGLGTVAIALSNKAAGESTPLWRTVTAVVVLLAVPPILALSKSTVASPKAVKVLLCLAALGALAFGAAHVLWAASISGFDFLFPVGGISMAAFMALAGIAILVKKSWRGWPAATPLLLGFGSIAVMYIGQQVLGEDSQLPIAGVGLLQALFGLAVTKAPAKA